MAKWRNERVLLGRGAGIVARAERAALIRPNCDGRHCFLLVIPLVFDATTSIWHHHGHIRSRALLSWPLGTARRAVRRGRECRRSGLQGGRGAPAQRRRTQKGSATRPEAWERKPIAEAILRRLRRCAG